MLELAVAALPLGFPFLFGGTFIEGLWLTHNIRTDRDFPSFSEGLSLRARGCGLAGQSAARNFPSFSEGLSLRAVIAETCAAYNLISLPFRRDFH